ncbi:MAG: discoidin domain-containing protein, partial [Chitinophagaceae bacterium]
KLATKDKSGKLTHGVTKKHYQKNYTGPVTFTESGEVVALYTNRKGYIDTAVFNLKFNKATGKKITLAQQPSRSYPGDGAFTLVNGLTNTAGLSRSREFLGFNSGQLEATIDLGNAQKITNVVVHGMRSEGSWIYAPAGAEVWTSADGKNFTQAGSTTAFDAPDNGKGRLEVSLKPTTARYVKVVVKRLDKIPDGKPGAGNGAWLFVDEIEVH